MIHLEPAYLRYIYDGLIKGGIHPENAAELPDGLIGLYEVAFDESISVLERQKLLQRFTIWALLKKEVSAAFVAEVLGEVEDDIQEFISTYSAWFNSPESGKYQLYHERLKVYLLQKLSEREVHVLHEKLIGRLELAIQKQNADEFEWYGLEFLVRHLGTSAMLDGNGSRLIDLAYSQTLWQRQLKFSKGYTWTNNGLLAVMTWASKFNDDEVIECGLQLVDLHHKEQNAAPQIVALVAEGDFDAALKLIERFGGSDKEGVRRKFIVYMLCIMELTLFDSKDFQNSKEGIELLLKHLDEQLPVDHSVLNWSDFFPSKLMFDVLICLFKQNISIEIFTRRSNFFDLKFLIKSEKLSEVEVDLIQKIFLFNTEPSVRTTIMISELSNLLYTQNYVFEAKVLRLTAIDICIDLKGDYRSIALKSIVSICKFEKNNSDLINLISDTDSELLRKEVCLRSNEEVELFNDLIADLICDVEFVEERLRLIQIGIEVCLEKKESLGKLINIYIKNLEELDTFEQPEFQSFLVEVYCKQNLIEMAVEVADSIELIREQEIAFSRIALWYFNQNDQSYFNQFFEKIDSAEIKCHVYSDLIVSIRNNDQKIVDNGFFELLIFELRKIELYTTDDWGITEYPRNDIIHKLGMKLQTNGFIELAIELGTLLIDEWNSKQKYYCEIFSEFNFLKDGVLSSYFLEYFLKVENEIDIRKRDDYLTQIIRGCWLSGQSNKILTILHEITNSNKQEEIVSDLVFWSVESFNFSFLQDLIVFVDKNSKIDYFLSKAILRTEINFEIHCANQIFNYFLDNKEKNKNLAFFVQRQFDFNRPTLGIQLIELIDDPFWKVTGLEYSVYYYAKLLDIENGKKQLDYIEVLRGSFELNIDVKTIKMKFYDLISSKLYANNNESWKEFINESISVSQDISDERVRKFNKYLFLLMANKRSELLVQIELIKDEWERARVISSFGFEFFRFENIEIIDRLLSLYPSNQKTGSPEYKKLICNFILLCEENDQIENLDKYYEHFVLSWSDSLELAKDLCRIDRFNKADQVLSSINDFRIGLAYIRLAEFVRENFNDIEFKPLLEKGISLSMSDKDLIGIQSSVLELVHLGSFSLAEEISFEIGTVMGKQECWSDIGRLLYSSRPENLINYEFNDLELKKFANRGWFEKLTIYDFDKSFLVKYLPHFITDISITKSLLEKYFLKMLFLNDSCENFGGQIELTLGIKWAGDIKKQLI